VGNKELTDKKKGATIPPLLRRKAKLTKKYSAILNSAFLGSRVFIVVSELLNAGRVKN